MKTKRLVTTLLAGSLAVTTALALSEDDDNGRGWRLFSRGTTGSDVAPVTNPQYTSECGACHFAYQPGLLPARSWKRIMSGLNDHFGENAELSPEVLDALTRYLVDTAADNSSAKRSRKITASLTPNDAPLRITEVPYIVSKHRELPNRVVKGNPKVGSLSRCAACHTQAAKGSFSERQIDIPGYGRWND